MKKLFLFVILLSVCHQAFRHAGVVASFYWNRPYIAKNLCEKRLVPRNGCNGQCVLMKRLQKEAEKEQKAPALQKLPEITWFFSSSPALPVWPGNVEPGVADVCWRVGILRTQTRLGAVFKPPDALLFRS